MSKQYYTIRDETIDRLRKILRKKLDVTKLPDEVEDIIWKATKSVRVRALEIAAFTDLVEIASKK